METDVPFVAAAFFCEKLLRESDEVISAIRIVDQILVMGPDPGGPFAPVPIRLFALVSLKSATISGQHSLIIRAHMPEIEGLTREQEFVENGVPFFMAAENLGTSTIINLNLQLPVPVGQRITLWFDVEFDGIVLTKIPLRLGYRLNDLDQEDTAVADDAIGGAIPETSPEEPK